MTAKATSEKADGRSAIPGLPFEEVSGGIAKDPASDRAVARYQGWLRECQATHEKCQQSAFKGLPKRVLDLRNPDICGNVRLRKTNKDDIFDRYMALSYCWEGERPLLTLQENVHHHLQRISWESLPSSYRDAVWLCRKLGIDYLWIDSLCIVQDDTTEWDHQTGITGDIYHNAKVVLVAASSSKPSDSILRRRYREIPWYASLQEQQQKPVTVQAYQIRKHRYDDAAEETLITTRAWCYQERLMARRCLVFGAEETTFECRVGCHCECTKLVTANKFSMRSRHKSQLMPDRLYVPLLQGSSPHLSTEDAYQYWRDAVFLYSTKQLSVPTDRLAAFTALTRTIQAATDDEYYAGLWKADLIHQMIWLPCNSGWPFAPSFPNVNFEAYVAPTWSWASYPGGVMYGDKPPRIEEYQAKILDVSCTLTGQNRFGAVKSGYLLLHARKIRAILAFRAFDDHTLSLRSDPSKPFRNWVTEILVGHTRMDFRDINLDCPVRAEHTTMRPGGIQQILQPNFDALLISGETVQDDCSGEATLLWLTKTNVLVLADSNELPQSYHRLGLVYISPDKQDELEWWALAFKQSEFHEAHII